MLSVLLLQESILLQGRVRLTLEFEEPTNYFSDIKGVICVLLLVKLELISEQMVLLLENCDMSQCIG